MAKVNVVTGFSRLRSDELSIRALTIVEKMTGNENFPDPVPALSEVTAAIEAYREALVLTPFGGKAQTAVKNENRKNLEAMLNRLGLYVQLNCKRDLAILLSSGFNARRRRSVVGRLEKPASFQVLNGLNTGSMKLRINRIKGAWSYRYEYAAAPVSDATHWSMKMSTRRTNVIEGLTSGRQYAFRVTPVGTDPGLSYSDVISRFVS